MTTLAYPSALFPGRPELEIDLPEDWQPVPAATEMSGVALAALRPLPEDEFKANLVVAVDEVPAGHTVVADLEGVVATAAERTDGAVGEVHARTIDGVTFFGRDLSYVDPLAGTLLTSSLFGFLRRDTDRGLVRITVTTTIGAARHREDHAAVQAIVDTLRVHPADGTTPLVDDAAATTD